MRAGNEIGKEVGFLRRGVAPNRFVGTMSRPRLVLVVPVRGHRDRRLPCAAEEDHPDRVAQHRQHQQRERHAHDDRAGTERGDQHVPGQEDSDDRAKLRSTADPPDDAAGRIERAERELHDHRRDGPEQHRRKEEDRRGRKLMPPI